jgi:hypothetical protein
MERTAQHDEYNIIIRCRCSIQMDFNNTKEKVNLRNKQFSLNGKRKPNNSKTDKQTLELSQKMINLL